MKWVRFARDFDPLRKGLLNYLLKNGDTLVPDPGTKHTPSDPNILISRLHDPVIDNSFRIYNLTWQQFEQQYLDPRASYKDPGVFHMWRYEMEVPTGHTPSGILNSYETFAGGWIEFWDQEVRHGNTDHAIYFKSHMRGPDKYQIAYILQTLVNPGWNSYLNIADPPTSTDPPPPPGKPPY